VIEQRKQLVQIGILEIQLEQLAKRDDVQRVRVGQPEKALAQLRIPLALDQAQLLDRPLDLHNVAGKGDLHVAGPAHHDDVLEGIVRGGYSQSPRKMRISRHSNILVILKFY